MQTFLPYPDFQRTAAILDSRRLGKQRIEAKHILSVLHDGGYWEFHPAVRMWRGYEEALALYMDTMIIEWVRRGYNNTMLLAATSANAPRPLWLGNTAFHISHQSNLIRKDPAYYRPIFPGILASLPYVWPA